MWGWAHGAEKDHPDIATSLNNLALLYDSQLTVLVHHNNAHVTPRVCGIGEAVPTCTVVAYTRSLRLNTKTGMLLNSL